MVAPFRATLLFLAVAVAGCPKPPGNSTPDLSVSTTILCKSSSDCPPQLPTCEPLAGVCVGCLSDMNTCPKGQLCDDSTHLCRARTPSDPECQRDSDCPPVGEVSQRSICRVDAGMCAECRLDADCGEPKPVCDNGMNLGVPDLGHIPTYNCIDGCTLCVPPLPVCDRMNSRCLSASDGGS